MRAGATADRTAAIRISFLFGALVYFSPGGRSSPRCHCAMVTEYGGSDGVTQGNRSSYVLLPPVPLAS